MVVVVITKESGVGWLRRNPSTKGSPPLHRTNVGAEGVCCQPCQLSGADAIGRKGGTGVGVCLVPACHGANPYGLAGAEVGCLVVGCHRFGWLVACEL